MKLKTGIILLTLVCGAATALALHGLGRLDLEVIQARLAATGIWAPLIYILLYVVATLLILPSTALNLSGGALFGPGFGILWTSVGAILAAAAAFWFSRTIGRETMEQRLSGRWQVMDREIQRGGFFYMFAIRLVPIMPYGLVNLVAGLTSISFKDYILGTAVGTIPSVLPFVLLGSSGVTAIQTGDLLPLLGALGLTGVLVAGSTWYRRSQKWQGSEVLSQKNATKV